MPLWATFILGVFLMGGGLIFAVWTEEGLEASKLPMGWQLLIRLVQIVLFGVGLALIGFGLAGDLAR